MLGVIVHLGDKTLKDSWLVHLSICCVQSISFSVIQPPPLLNKHGILMFESLTKTSQNILIFITMFLSHYEHFLQTKSGFCWDLTLVFQCLFAFKLSHARYLCPLSFFNMARYTTRAQAGFDPKFCMNLTTLNSTV